jgi:hypothetical protein
MHYIFLEERRTQVALFEISIQHVDWPIPLILFDKLARKVDLRLLTMPKYPHSRSTVLLQPSKLPPPR